MYAFNAGCLCPMSKSGERRKKETKRTKEAKVTSVDYCLCIFIANQVIQGREMTPDVGNAKYSTMDGVN
jgi:hypothetical protein